MAVDSTYNDEGSSSDETKDPPSSSIGSASSAPKPPRPARRPGTFARVPMPDGFHPPSSGLPISSEGEAAPPSPASGVPDFDTGRAMVSAPPVRFEADASDSSPPVGVEPEDEEHEQAEQTIVGQVPRRLLELSSSVDENTRAYTAPQELIELARRKREERLRSKAPPTEANVRETERPPAHRRPLESIPEESFEGVMPDDDESLAFARADAEFEADAAPAIDRPSSGPPIERKSDISSAPGGSSVNAPRKPISSVPHTPTSAAPSTPISLVPRPAASAAPAVTNSLIDRIHGAESSAPAVAARAGEGSEPAPESVVASVQKSSWLGGGRSWIIVIGLFIALGVALARWRGLERFFLH